MIETYKIVTGKYQPCVAPTLHKGNVFVTRGNDLRLGKSQVKYDLRKFVFSERELHVHIRYLLSPVRLSSVCRLKRSCALLDGRFKFSAIFLWH